VYLLLEGWQGRQVPDVEVTVRARRMVRIAREVS
jgi:hypothetical protein